MMLAAVVLANAASASADTLVDCPLTLKVVSTVEAPAGWEQVPQSLEPTLSGVSVYEGHPSQEYNLAPRNLPVKDGFEVAQWGVGDGSWLVCHYTGTYAAIAKLIPKEFKSCRAYYKRQNFGRVTFAKFACE